MQAPRARAWSTVLEDPQLGSVRLSGRLRYADGETCLVVVHGLGGSPESFYCARAAVSAERSGLDCLRLALRGADRSGEDFYHAGLTEDLAAAIASQELARYKSIVLLGYSLGGHVCLRYALRPSDPRIAAVAAICPPLDLDRGAAALDRRRATIYRRHVLAGLNEIYGAVSRRRVVPTPLDTVRAARSIRLWDSLTVVPRHGFKSVDEYYRTMSVGPHLGDVAVPALLVLNPGDPMVPRSTYADHLQKPLGATQVEHVDAGGHVGFPSRVRFSDGTRRTVEEFAVAWLMGKQQ